MIEESDVKEGADARNPLFGGEDGQTIELNTCCRVKKPQAPAARGDWICYLLLCVLWDEIKSERAHGVVMEKLCSHIGSFPERKEYPRIELKYAVFN